MNNDESSRWENASLNSSLSKYASPENKQRILQARAQMLAVDTAQEGEAGEALEVLEFLLAGEKFSVESAYIREVLPLKEITPLPGTPAFVLGLINVRGQILSVIDLKRFFDLSHQGLTNLNKIILLHTPEMELGILADSVLGIRSIRQEDILAPPATITGVSEEYLKGITPNRMMVLNVVRILGDHRIIVHEEVA
jgi:purine-binding chemotaxis protein CheW